MENYLYNLYQMVLKFLISYLGVDLGVDQEKKKAGRPPKVSGLRFSEWFWAYGR